MLTSEQIQQYKQKYGITSTFDSLNVPPPDVRKSLFQEMTSGVKDIAVEGGERFLDNAKEFGGTVRSDQPVDRKVSSFASYALRQAGNLARTGAEFIAKPVAYGVEEAGKLLGQVPAFQEFAKTKGAEDFYTLATDTFGKIQGAVEQLRETNPDLAKDLESVAEIGLLLIGEKPAQKTLEKTGEIITKGVTKVGDTIAEGAEGVGKTIKEGAGKAGDLLEKVVAEPIAKPVETALKETGSKMFDEYVDVSKKAALSNKNPTPLEVAGRKAQEALKKIQDQLDTVGNLKKQSIESFGDTNVGTIATQFRQGLEKMLKSKTFVEGDKKMVNDLIAKARSLGNNPTAKQVDEFIDYAQDLLYTSGRDLTVPITDETTAELRGTLGKLNEGLKAKLPEPYRAFNKKFFDIIDVRNELNTKLGKEGEKGGSLMKRVFSPSDANTKQLFEEVKKMTGIDLVNEATLAKFVMEAVGDARQASLLEQLNIPTTKMGVLNEFMSKMKERFNTPDAIFERARQMTKPD